MSISDLRCEVKKILAELGSIAGYSPLEYFNKLTDEEIIKVFKDKTLPFESKGYYSTVQEAIDIMAIYSNGYDVSSYLTDEQQLKLFDISLRFIKLIK